MQCGRIPRTLPHGTRSSVHYVTCCKEADQLVIQICSASFHGSNYNNSPALQHCLACTWIQGSQHLAAQPTGVPRFAKTVAGRERKGEVGFILPLAWLISTAL